MDLLVETRDLSYRREGSLILDRLGLQIPERSVYGFLGPNGSGKTTTLKLLLGLLRPSAGQISFDGKPLTGQNAQVAQQCGALLDARAFYPRLSGRENLDLARRLLRLRPDAINRVLETVSLHPADLRRPVATYSLGMRQRLGIARALLSQPKLLILDEPCNGLDPQGITDMRHFLRTLPNRCGTTVLLSSHLLGEIEQTATHVGVLRCGKLVLQDSLNRLRQSHGTRIELQTDRLVETRELVTAQLGWETTLEADTKGMLVSAPETTPHAACERLACVLVEAGIAIWHLAPSETALEARYNQLQSEGRGGATQ